MFVYCGANFDGIEEEKASPNSNAFCMLFHIFQWKDQKRLFSSMKSTFEFLGYFCSETLINKA